MLHAFFLSCNGPHINFCEKYHFLDYALEAAENHIISNNLSALENWKPATPPLILPLDHLKASLLY